MESLAPALTTFAGKVVALVRTRGLPLLVAIGMTALVGAALWLAMLELLKSLASSAIPADAAAAASASPDLPSKGGIFFGIGISWAIIVAAMIVPMTAVTAALADEPEDGVLGWVSRAAKALPFMWIRLALPTAPLLLFAIWVVNDLINVLTEMFAAFGEALGGAEVAEPAIPLSLRLAKFLDGAPIVMYLVLATMLSLWLLWSTTRATGHDKGVVPHVPWNTFGRNPMAIVGLSAASAVVLGPLLGKAIEQAGSGLLPSLDSTVDAAGAAGASTLVVLTLGMIISAFVGLVAIPWIALFDDDLDESTAPAGDQLAFGAGTPGATHEPSVVDASLVLAPNAPNGQWWYLPAETRVYLQVAAPPGAQVSPYVSDAAGQPVQLHQTTAPGVVVANVTEASWYLLGAWSAGPTSTSTTVRLTLPPGAMPAPPAQQQAG